MVAECRHESIEGGDAGQFLVGAVSFEFVAQRLIEQGENDHPGLRLDPLEDGLQLGLGANHRP